MKRRWPLWGMALGTALAACLSIPEKTDVLDLRLLAVRVDPPEILYSFLHTLPADQRAGLPLGPYPVTVQVLAVDPRGNRVDVSARLCPEQTDDPCKGYIIRNGTPDRQIEDVRPLVATRSVQRQADVSLGGELSVPSIPFVFSQHAVDYMLTQQGNSSTAALGILFPQFPSFVVRVSLPDNSEQEVGFKRFSLAMDIRPDALGPEAAPQLEALFTQVLGVPFCPPDTPLDADEQCIRPRVANRNPTLERLLYSTTGGGGFGFGGGGGGGGGGPFGNGGVDGGEPEGPDDATSEGTFIDVGPRVTVFPGSTVFLRPVVAAHDHEPYQEVAFDTQSGKALLTNVMEDMAYTWTSTMGDISGTTSDDGLPASSGAADAALQVSLDVPYGPGYVWVVARDQRGGVDWRRLDFEVVPGGR